MPQYHGGKSRHSKAIYSAIMKDLNGKEIKGLVEPFCGGLNVTKEFINYKCYCFDSNEELIYMYSFIKDNGLPEMPIITKERHKELLVQEEYSFEGAFSNFFCTYMCKYRDSFASNDTKEKWHNQRYRSIEKSLSTIKAANFKCCKFTEIEKFIDINSGGYIIYCDPPYAGTTNYKNNDFNSDEFWTLVEKWSSFGNYVYVSELQCPIESEVIYEKSLNVGMSRNKNKMTDKLFKV